MFGREKQEVVVVMEKNSHRFMDCFGNEEVAVRSVMKAFPGAERVEENINQYGVRKKIHFTPADMTKEPITIICTEPSNEVQDLA